MLTKTRDQQPTRHRTHVREFTEAGARCVIYPPFSHPKHLDISSETKVGGIDITKLAVGTALDVLVVNNEIVGVENPAIHPFDLKKRFPNGLECVTATIETPSAGIYHAVTAKFARRGEETLYRITSLTGMFQAQADDDLRNRIYHGLKPQDSVNIWIDPSILPTKTGNPEPKLVFDAQFLSVNWR